MADVEKMPEDIAAVKARINEASDEEFMEMMGLDKTSGLVKKEEDAEADSEVEETESEAGDAGTEEADSEAADETPDKAEEAESREARKEKADAYRRGRAVADKAKAEEEAPEESKDETVPPEGEKEETAEGEEKVEEEKPLLTPFVLKQGEQEAEIPRDVTLDFKANGKEYKDIPLDKVVLWAQMGVYNEAREQEVQNAKQYVTQVSGENKQLRDLHEKLRKEFDDLLGDETYYDAARTEYLKHNTPEMRARRAEDKLRQEQETARQADVQRQAQTYIANEIFPAVEQIRKNNPTVSEDEVMGRFNRLILPYMQNGSVPPHLLPTVKQLVDTELATWARAITLERDSAKVRQEETVQKRIKTEQTKTTLAKRQLARAVKPQTGVEGAVKERKKPKVYKSADDWAQSALDEVIGQR